MGIWPPYSNGTEVCAVDVSVEKGLIVTGNASGGITRLFNYPCVVKNGTLCYIHIICTLLVIVIVFFCTYSALQRVCRTQRLRGQRSLLSGRRTCRHGGRKGRVVTALDSAGLRVLII